MEKKKGERRRPWDAVGYAAHQRDEIIFLVRGVLWLECVSVLIRTFAHCLP